MLFKINDKISGNLPQSVGNVNFKFTLMLKHYFM